MSAVMDVATLSELYDLYDNDPVFTHLRRGSKQLVRGKGPDDPLVIFIGEAPGATEDNTGEPFVGRSGEFLNELLASINLNRDDAFITNIVKYRPKDNRDPSIGELMQSVDYIEREIALLDHESIICPMGRQALSVFFSNMELKSVHGTRLERNGRLYVPLYHPAVALYNPGYRPKLMTDFKMIGQILDERGR
jgi:DNA polymerase